VPPCASAIWRLNARPIPEPAADPHLAAGLHRRVDGIPHDVDQKLFELIGIGFDLHVLRRAHLDRQPVLELGDPLRERHDLNRPLLRLWQLRQLGVLAQEAPERASIRFRPFWISAARGTSGIREIIRLMLCAIDLIGVSELLISCDRTRTMRPSRWRDSFRNRAVTRAGLGLRINDNDDAASLC
jgi:hypothetical protein